MKSKLLFVAAAATAVSLMSLSGASAEGGCGPGWHRNPWGHCRPNGPVEVVPPVVVAPPVVVPVAPVCGPGFRWHWHWRRCVAW